MIKNVLKYRKIILGIMLSLGLFFCSENVYAKSVEEMYKYCTYHVSDKGTDWGQGAEYDITFIETDGKILLWNSSKSASTDKIDIDHWNSITLGNTSNETLTSIFGIGENFNCPDNPYIARTTLEANTSSIREYFISVENTNPMIGFGTEFFRPDVSLISGQSKLKCPDNVIRSIKEEANKLREEMLDSIYINKSKELDDHMKGFLDNNNVTEQTCQGYMTYNNFDIEDLYPQSVKDEFTNAVKEMATKKIIDNNNCDSELDYTNLGFGSNANLQTYLNRLVGIPNYEDEKLMSGNLYGKLKANYERCLLRAKMQGSITDEEKETLEEEQDKKIEEEKEKAAEYIEDFYNDYKHQMEMLTSLSFGGNVSLTCEGILGADLIELINQIFDYVKIAAPILLIVFGTIDFSGAVISQDKDALGKAFSKFIKRALICAAIFFIPIILSWLISNAKLPDGTPLAEDPLCGIK